jgi:tetratricopeptide (TPR) repeat protein
MSPPTTAAAILILLGGLCLRSEPGADIPAQADVPARGEAPDLARAGALLEAGRFGEARELADLALEGKPPAEEALLWRWLVAESYQLEGDYEEAERAYDALTRGGPPAARTEAALRLGKCRLRMSDTEAAMKALGTLGGTALGERAWEKEELEAIALFTAGKARAALEILKRLPQKSDAGWHYLGLIEFNTGKYAEAAESFERALALVPGDYYNMLYRAQSLLELDRLGDARKVFHEILAFAPTAEAHQLLGRLEIRAGRFEEAESQLRKALEVSPGHAEAQFGLATALRRLQKTEEARQAVERFRELHATQQENIAIAYKLYQEHAARPKDPELAERLARHYLATEDPAAAERTAWHAVRADPSRIQGRLILARSYAKVGRYREAAVHYRRILRADPEQPEATAELRELIARHARRVGELKER